MRTCFIAAVLALQPIAVAESPEEAVGQLGSESFVERERAYDAVWAMGRTALPALRQGEKSGDPELRHRAASLRKWIELGVTKETPRELRREFERFSNAPERDQKRLLRQLSETDRTACINLLRAVRDTGRRERLAKDYYKDAVPRYRKLLIDGEEPKAIAYLRQAALLGVNVDAFASVLIIRRELEAEIANLAASGTGQELRLRGRLLALGALPGGEAFLQNDNETRGSTAVAYYTRRARWRDLAMEIQTSGPSDLPAYTKMAMAAKWAADEQLYAAALSGAEEWLCRHDDSGNRTLGTTLLAASVGDHIALARRRGRDSHAFEMLVAAGQVRDALDSVGLEAGADARSWASARLVAEEVDRWLLQQVAETLNSVGERESAGDICVALCEHFDPLGQNTEYWWALGIALGSGFASEVSHTIPLSIHPTEKQIRRTLPPISNSVPDAYVLWRALVDYSSARSGSATDELISAFGDVLHGRWSEREVEELLEIAVPMFVSEPRLRRGRSAIEGLTARHGRVHHRRLIADFRNSDPDLIEQHLHAGGAALAEGDTGNAEQLFENVIDELRLADGDRLPLLVAAEFGLAAISKLSGELRGGEQRGSKSMGYLVNPAELWELAEALGRFGIPHERSSIARIALAMPTWRHDPHSRIAVAKFALDEADRQGVAPSRAANLHETYLMAIESPSIFAHPITARLDPIYDLHRHRAAAALSDDRYDTVAAEAGRCFATSRFRIDHALELVPGLTGAGRDDLADAVFLPLHESQVRHCSAFPAHAQGHNRLAWTAARCGRKLDLALRHAEMAVDLSPGNAAFLDTLAEVYFRLGDLDSAVAWSRRAVALAPSEGDISAQLEKFERALAAGGSP